MLRVSLVWYVPRTMSEHTMRKTGEERSDSRSAGGLQAMLTKDRETNESRNVRMHGISAAQQVCLVDGGCRRKVARGKGVLLRAGDGNPICLLRAFRKGNELNLNQNWHLSFSICHRLDKYIDR